jgi:hypothetical protein
MSNAFVAAIPFDLLGTIVILPVQINGRALSFELDSGFETNTLDRTQATQLGLQLTDEQVVNAPGGSVEQSKAHEVALSLPGVNIPAQTMTVVPLGQFAPIFGHSVDGILGFDFFNRFVVEIDYEAQYLRLYNPEGYEYSGPGESIPISLGTRQPYLHANIVQLRRGTVRGRFELDTGSMDAMCMTSQFVDAHHLILPDHPLLQLRGISLGGETLARLTRVQALQIGQFRIDWPVTGIVTEDVDRAGQISGEILRRFKVVFDYTRRRVILEKNRHFAEPFDFDRSGTFIISEGPSFKVFKIVQVFQDSPAAEAGLHEGDVIKTIDGKPSVEFTLNEIREMFKKGEQRYRLTVQRNHTEIQAEIQPRKLI